MEDLKLKLYAGIQEKFKYVHFMDLENDQYELIILRKLHVYLNQLNEEQRICINLFYLQEKTYAEVSKITGFSFRKVKSFIQNGKRNLRILILRDREHDKFG